MTALQIAFAAITIAATSMSAHACPLHDNASQVFSYTVIYFLYCRILSVIYASSPAFSKPHSLFSSPSVHSHGPVVPKMSSDPA